MGASGTGQAWNLDLLGSWHGDSTTAGLREYTINDASPRYHPDVDTSLQARNDETNQANLINQHMVDGTVTLFAYDEAGNLKDDGEKKYTYDAPALDSRLRQRGGASLLGTLR